jgi:hypothetical protein
MSVPSRTELMPLLLADFDGNAGGSGVPHPARRGAAAAPGADVALRLPPPSPPTRSVGMAVAGRRAERSYADQPVSAADLHAVCAQARAAGGHDRPGGAGVEVYAVVTRVDGIDAGVYRYVPTGHLGRAGELGRAALREIFLQEEFSRAPVVLLLVGDLAAAIDARGSHGYRLLMTRAGAASQEAWIAAEQRALVGCVFAGVRGGHLADHVDIDGYHRTFLVAIALGHRDWGGT